MANSLLENTLSVVDVAIVAEEIGNFEIWIIMPFGVELSVKIAGPAKFRAKEMALLRERMMHA